MSPATEALFAFVARTYLASLRVTLLGDRPERGILALWHQDLAVCMQAFAHRNIHVMLSASRDGGIAARTSAGLGYRVVRGSSSRQGAAALRQLVRKCQEKPGLIGMALDGPRGPRGQVKPGTLWLAQTLGMPVFPLGVAVLRSWRLHRSWDQARLPWPWLGRAVVVVGPACEARSEALEEGMRETAKRAADFL